MAIHKAKVIGTHAINGAAPGRMTHLDDEVFNVPALVDAEHVKVIEPRKTTKDDD